MNLEWGPGEKCSDARFERVGGAKVNPVNCFGSNGAVHVQGAQVSISFQLSAARLWAEQRTCDILITSE